jgi:2-polyprenyl-3-methyl-5-hydroxy-6-metoxy-1,4-benzoquinol methylase
MWSRDIEGAEATAIAVVADLRGKRVLDVGCGKGRLTEVAARQAREVLAFDPDADAVAEARRRLRDAPGDVRVVEAHVETVDLPRRRFDIAFCGWSL